MLVIQIMWTRVTSASKQVSDKRTGETMHLQTRLFGGVDVIRSSSRSGGRSSSKNIEFFESHAQAERHVRKVLAEDGFRAVGENLG